MRHSPGLLRACGLVAVAVLALSALAARAQAGTAQVRPLPSPAPAHGAASDALGRTGETADPAAPQKWR